MPGDRAGLLCDVGTQRNRVGVGRGPSQRAQSAKGACLEGSAVGWAAYAERRWPASRHW